MLNVTLSKGQALTLLHELARDDTFRERFERAPADALAELGVERHAFDGQSAMVVLADKAKFEAAHQVLLQTESAGQWKCMVVPGVMLDLANGSLAPVKREGVSGARLGL
ncbi:NHLP-related RiPP peptide [Mizugakiibacter sediminis]|nr:NHLP-related RiPP peptide [Mizugakiibacter sediminis]